MNNSFNVEEFEAVITRTLNDFQELLKSFPIISNTYNKLSTLTQTEDTKIRNSFERMEASTNGLYNKCMEIEQKMTEWIVRYRNAIVQSDEELLATCDRISKNLASYNQELSSLSL